MSSVRGAARPVDVRPGGTAVMLKIRSRVSAISLVPLLGLIGFSSLSILDNWHRMNAAQQLRDEVTVALAVGELGHQLQIERGMSAAFLADKGAQPDALRKQREIADRTAARLTGLGNEGGGAAQGELAAALGAMDD